MKTYLVFLWIIVITIVSYELSLASDKYFLSNFTKISYKIGLLCLIVSHNLLFLQGFGLFISKKIKFSKLSLLVMLSFLFSNFLIFLASYSIHKLNLSKDSISKESLEGFILNLLMIVFFFMGIQIAGDKNINSQKRIGIFPNIDLYFEKIFRLKSEKAKIDFLIKINK